MPSVAVLERKGAPFERSLFERVRESGQAAATIAERLPAILADPALSIDALYKLIVGIDTRRTESERIVQEAENAENPRLLSLAQQIENLWTTLAAKAVARVQRNH